MGFTNQAGSDLSGRVSWLQSAQPAARTYPAGFALPDGLQAVGALYSFAKGVPLVSLPNGGVVLLENGNLAQRILYAFSIDAQNHVSGANGLNVRLSPGSGLFSGQVLEPGTHRRLAFRGALLQKQNAGYGYFVGDGDRKSVV